MSPDARRRLRGLDALRGLAALGVVALHVAFYTARPGAPWNLGESLLQGLRLGVPMFFVLSGFLLARPWLTAARGGSPPPHAGAYLVRRAARVVPAYYAALAFAWLVLLGTGSARLPHAGQLPLLLALGQNWSPDAADKLVPPAWTLCVETTFYFVLPLVGLAIVRWCPTLRRQLTLCLGLAAVSVACNAVVAGLGEAQWHRTLPGLGYEFALGMAAAAVLARRPPGRRARAALVAAGWVLVVGDALAHEPLAAPGIAVWGDLPAALGFAGIVAAVASGRAGLLDLPVLRWLGGRSYGLFLLHYPVILMLTSRGNLPASPVLALAVVLALSLALAELSWRFVERPALELARRRGPRPYPSRGRGGQLARASA